MNLRTLLFGWCFYCLLLAGSEVTFAHEIRFVIDHIPANTPHDASIYLVTHVDGWQTDKDTRKFSRNADGKLELIFEHPTDTVYYKITRGTWESVEARQNGRARPNRMLIASKNDSEIHLTVESWEDTSYRWYVVYMFFLMIAALQGILLTVAINTIRNKNKLANRYLSILLALITVALLGRASTFDPDIFTWQPKLLFVPELILFAYGPVFYIYMHRLLVIEVAWKKIWPMWLPIIFQIVLFLPFLLMEKQTFIFKVIDKVLFPYFAITGVVALLLNGYYWWLYHQLIKRYKTEDHLSDKQKNYIRFLKWILKIKAIYLILWLAVVIIFLTGKLIGKDLLYISENMIDLLWLVFSLVIYALAYFAVKHPEMLRERKKYQETSLKNDEIQDISGSLDQLLNSKKVFTHADLTLESLAHMVPTSTHTLSRFINEQYGQSFNDLINEHRIKAFTLLMEEKTNLSILEAALQVGFGSKPTFNRAFKKVKGCTPSEYFKKNQV